MTTSGDDKLATAQQKLETLRKGFANRLRERVAVLIATIEAYIDGDNTQREVARGLAHKLNGTAGSYGFPEISVWAAHLEQTLGSDAPDPTTLREQAQRLQDQLDT